MIELLPLLYPSANTVLASLADNGRRRDTRLAGADSTRCPACRRRPSLQEDCQRCHGTGRMREVAGQVSSGETKRGHDESAAYVASLLIGAPRHKVDAALVYVVGDMAAGERLAARLGFSEFHHESARWEGLAEEEKTERVVRLSALVVNDLAQMPLHEDGTPLSQAAKYRQARIGKTQWFGTWSARYERVFDRVHGWTTDVDEHMAARAQGRRRRSPPRASFPVGGVSTPAAAPKATMRRTRWGVEARLPDVNGL